MGLMQWAECNKAKLWQHRIHLNGNADRDLCVWCIRKHNSVSVLFRTARGRPARRITQAHRNAIAVIPEPT